MFFYTITPLIWSYIFVINEKLVTQNKAVDGDNWIEIINICLKYLISVNIIYMILYNMSLSCDIINCIYYVNE